MHWWLAHFGFVVSIVGRVRLFDRLGHPPRDQYNFDVKLNDEPAMTRDRDSFAWRRRRVEIDLSIAWRARASNTLHSRAEAMYLCSGG